MSGIFKSMDSTVLAAIITGIAAIIAAIIAGVFSKVKKESKKQTALVNSPEQHTSAKVNTSKNEGKTNELSGKSDESPSQYSNAEYKVSFGIKFICMAKDEFDSRGERIPPQIREAVSEHTYDSRDVIPSYAMPVLYATIKNISSKTLQYEKMSLSFIGEIFDLRNSMTYEAISAEVKNAPTNTPEYLYINKEEEYQFHSTVSHTLLILNAIKQAGVSSIQLKINDKLATIPFSEFNDFEKYCKDVVPNDLMKMFSTAQKNNMA